MDRPVPDAIEILLVEDDAADEFLTREALSQHRVINNVSSVKDGIEAMAYLRKEPPYEDAVRPDLVLLDLNLPRMSGREVLEEVKGDPLLRSIPVVILTTSQAEEDITMAYGGHANVFVSKPVELDKFLLAIRQLDDFFISVVRLPGR